MLTWLWIMLAVQMVVLLWCCAGIFLEHGKFGVFPVRPMPQYQESIQAIRTNEEIRQKVGSPVEVDLSKHDFQTKSGRTEVTYSFRITGPEGEGIAEVEMVNVDGIWQYDKFYVIFDDGIMLDLRP